MVLWKNGKRKYLIIGVIVLICSTLIATFAYHTATTAKVTQTTPTILKIHTPITATYLSTNSDTYFTAIRASTGR